MSCPLTTENAMRLAILAFTVLALTGVAYAQDDNGGGGGDNAVTPTEAAAPDEAASEAPDTSDEASSEICADGAPPCVAATSSNDPLAMLRLMSEAMPSGPGAQQTAGVR